MTDRQCLPISGSPRTCSNDVTVNGRLLRTAEPRRNARARDLLTSSSLYLAFVSRISKALWNERKTNEKHFWVIRFGYWMITIKKEKPETRILPLFFILFFFSKHPPTITHQIRCIPIQNQLQLFFRCGVRAVWLSYRPIQETSFLLQLVSLYSEI